jgi:prepilin-type N-terminal cleavage/methylation domain-containing protein
MRLSNSRAARQGFSLAEVIISLFVLSIAMLGTLWPPWPTPGPELNTVKR